MDGSPSAGLPQAITWFSPGKRLLQAPGRIQFLSQGTKPVACPLLLRPALRDRCRSSLSREWQLRSRAWLVGCFGNCKRSGSDKLVIDQKVERIDSEVRQLDACKVEIDLIRPKMGQP